MYTILMMSERSANAIKLTMYICIFRYKNENTFRVDSHEKYETKQKNVNKNETILLFVIKIIRQSSINTIYIYYYSRKWSYFKSDYITSANTHTHTPLHIHSWKARRRSLLEIFDAIFLLLLFEWFKVGRGISRINICLSTKVTGFI